jgi:hypothetical protein
MAGERFLPAVLMIVAVGVIVGPISPVFASPPTCTVIEIASHTCNVDGSINGGGVDLSGHKGVPGSGNSSPSGRKSGKRKPAAPVCQGLPAACQKIVVVPPGAPGNSAVTISDLKSFPAIPGTDHMEPNGWMVVGLDTNFYSVVPTELVNGVLLGNPATVRFTPVAWHWTYGDGTAAARTTPGTTWLAQGIPEFDPTPTSHVYTAEGTYFIDLSITFTADYKYASGNWTHVLGTITLPANRLQATAGGAKTVLVNRDCAQNPSGPGC